MYDVISLPAGPTQVTIERYLVHAIRTHVRIDPRV